MKGNYRTRDRLEIYLTPEGKVTGVWMYFAAFSELNAPDDVKVEDYGYAIEEKLRELYVDNYAGYAIQNVRRTQVERKAGLYAQISANFMQSGYKYSDFVEMFIEIMP